MAEGAPLLREYAVMSCIKGSNPFVSATSCCKPLIGKGISKPGGFDPTSTPHHREWLAELVARVADLHLFS